MKPWIAAKKIVNLLFVGTNEVGKTDNATPPWVLAQTGSNHVDLVPCPDPGGGVVVPPTPVYWEQGYATPWHKFITAVIEHYGTNPNVGYMRFGLGAGAEDFPQHGADGNCFAAWQPYGLSAKFWAQFSARLTGFIAAAARRQHSTVQQIVALNPFSDPAQPFDVANEVAKVAAADGVAFGTENLGSGHYGWTVERVYAGTSIGATRSKRMPAKYRSSSSRSTSRCNPERTSLRCRSCWPMPCTTTRKYSKSILKSG